MLKCSTSLWSADLGKLAEEIRRVEPYSERFHLDVADGHYVPALLFFPDLVKSLRRHTQLPFEVHLMTTEPDRWIDPFIEVGADIVVFCHDSARDPDAVLRQIKACGKKAGVSLLIDEPVDCLASCWQDLDVLTLCGTAMGIKGASMDPGVPQKVRTARDAIAHRGLPTEIEVDGGIRRTSVPLIAAAGADYIVPGSLMFGEDPKTMREWLATLPCGVQK
jgi:ribulose-phosphate 3-epimerase